MVGLVGAIGRSIGGNVTGCIVGDDVGCIVFGLFAGGGATGLGGVAGTIVVTLTGRNEGLSVRVGANGALIGCGDGLVATSLVIVSVNVPTCPKRLWPVTKK